jgi:microcystin-dependent protein
MMEPFIGEIMLFAGNFAPRGWAFCNGQEISIAQNTALFSILGTTYGGNGQTTFKLPDLRGRAPIHLGQGPGLTGRILGEMSGSENVTLNQTQIPAHTHSLMGNNGGANTSMNDKAVLSNQINDDGELLNTYNSGFPSTTLSSHSISSIGGGQPHNNMQPYLVMNYCIALEGIFPSRS